MQCLKFNLTCSKDLILDIVRIMPKVTSKLQLTVPKVIADQYGIRPGDELKWIPAGESIRVELVGRKPKTANELTAEERLELFDAAMRRVDKIQAEELRKNKGNRITRENRGWTREELYDRGFSR
jgi:bifunctional DNA-binding transcriptional regulator/antitoxin component of YhaV-PrlF toxin-antitoxin module